MRNIYEVVVNLGDRIYDVEVSFSNAKKEESNGKILIGIGDITSLKLELISARAEIDSILQQVNK